MIENASSSVGIEKDDKERRNVQLQVPERVAPEERLWHEPPILDYTKDEDYKEVQKKFKETGGPKLVSRTAYLDSYIEGQLGVEYGNWCDETLQLSSLNEEEKLFYEHLKEDLHLEGNVVSVPTTGRKSAEYERAADDTAAMIHRIRMKGKDVLYVKKIEQRLQRRKRGEKWDVEGDEGETVSSAVN